MSFEKAEINSLADKSTKDLLKNNKETQNNEVFDFFEFSDNEISNFIEKKEIFEKIWLNFWKLLFWYRKYINENLSWLDPKIINKIKKSIKIKVLNSANKVNEIIERAKSGNEDILSYRWIINEKIWDELSFINYELLPTAALYLKKDNIDFWYFDKWAKTEEMDEMFNSPIDKNWNFDEWFFSTQIVFDYEKWIDIPVLEKNKIPKVVWVDMLSEKDRDIEWNIMLKYIAFVSTMLLPVAWAITSVPSDIVDMLGSDEWVLNSMKITWLLTDEENNYKMNKNWFDPVFWAAWLVWTAFWAQWLFKWWKFAIALTKLERLWFKSDVILSKIAKYQDKFKRLLLNWKGFLNDNWFKKSVNFEEGNKLDLWEWFNYSEIKKWLSGLDKLEKLPVEINIDIKWDNVEKIIENKLLWLSENLNKNELDRLEIIIVNKSTSSFDSEKAAIDNVLLVINKVKNLSLKYNTNVLFKVEPLLIKNHIEWEKDILMNYYSIAEIIAKSSLENSEKYILLWTRSEVATMIESSMIKNIDDESRFSQYDTIVYNAVQRFNNTRDPNKFLEDIYLALKDSNEFSKWEIDTYWKNKKSWLAKLIKLVNKKWWVWWDIKRKQFIEKMWKWFDQIEYTDLKLFKKIKKLWLKWEKNIKSNILKILKDNWLELYKYSDNNINLKFVDNWIIWKDKILNSKWLHSDFVWHTDKAWYEVKVILSDENGNPYNWWLFIPLKETSENSFIKPDFIYKKDIEKLSLTHKKIELLKWLWSVTKNDDKLLLKVSEKISIDELERLTNKWITLPKDILKLYSNLIDNWYYKKTNFYDFIVNAPKDLRFLSELDWKTTLWAKTITKYNDYSFNSQTFEKVPTTFVSVYHYTTLEWLAKIAVSWIVPRWKLMEDDIYVAANAGSINLQIANDYDKTASKWVSRNNCVFAYLAKKIKWERNYGNWWVCFEIKVNPKKVLVADADHVTDDFDYPSFADKWTKVSWKKYWEESITLYEFNKLSKKEQEIMFRHPEVVIPNWVEKDYIRIVTN